MVCAGGIRPKRIFLIDNGFSLSEEHFAHNGDEESLAEILAGVNPWVWLRLLLGAEGTRE